MLFPGVIANRILQGGFSTFDDSCLFKGGHSVDPCSPVERLFAVDFVFFLATLTSKNLSRIPTVRGALLRVLESGLL